MTDTLGDIKAAYASRAVDPDGLFLLSAQDAAKYVSDLQRAGLVVAGVEGFLITSEGAYQPMMDLSNDIADHTGNDDEFFTATRSLIAAANDNNPAIYFQVDP